MPEWAIPLVGVAGGVVATLAGAWFTASFQERRERRKRGAELVARLRVLLIDADPRGLVYFAASDQERARRSGEDVWRRWRELREPFLTFSVATHPTIQRTAREAATQISLSIQASRDAIEASSGGVADKVHAVSQYKVASESVDELDRAFAARRWRA